MAVPGLNPANHVLPPARQGARGQRRENLKFAIFAILSVGLIVGAVAWATHGFTDLGRGCPRVGP